MLGQYGLHGFPKVSMYSGQVLPVKILPSNQDISIKSFTADGSRRGVFKSLVVMENDRNVDLSDELVKGTRQIINVLVVMNYFYIIVPSAIISIISFAYESFSPS